MIYELRIYDAMPGKLAALHTRFTTATVRLFEKHGIKPVGFWTTYIGPNSNTLTYILAWEDLGERQRRWDAFASDPEWQAAKAESEKDGSLTERVQNMIMQPTGYSPLQ
ncbi:MAG: NIPSNAP family protein [Herpetosiphonaceae bacterium]|nr:NIPSNAP family protein [Herpetosiphonaceae bacterium]